jgi:hypothetical protein
MAGSNSSSPKAKLSAGQKVTIAGLLCLQVLSGAIFYPPATIIILTGVGAPLSMVLWKIGTIPYSSAMRRKADWESGGEQSVGAGQLAEAAAADAPERVPSPD